MTVRFEVGKTYKAPLGDFLAFSCHTIAKRTAKTVTLEGGKSKRVKLVDGVEELNLPRFNARVPVLRATRDADRDY